MTEARPRRRLSKRALRAWAWVAGIATFATPAAALGAEPKAPSNDHDGSARPVVIVRTVTRRVIVRERSRPTGIRYVTPAASSGSSSAPAASTSTRGS